MAPTDRTPEGSGQPEGDDLLSPVEAARLADQLEATAAKINTGQVADAPRGNWVDHLAPPVTRPFLRLSRADRPIGTWLLWLPCLWALALAANDGSGFSWWDLWLVASSGAGAFLMRGAGCTWNDITDRDFDASVARTRSRPLPSGQVTVKGAVIWMAAQALIAALILFSYNRLAITLGIGSLALVMIYPFAKRFTWWPQVFLGFAFNWGALLLWAAHSEDLPVAAVILWLAGIAWTLFYDTIYAHQDKEDDALIGVKSTARLFADRTGQWLAGFLVLSVLLFAAAVILTIPASRGILPVLMALCGIWAFGLHLFWQLRQLDADDPAICLRLFKSNRDAGLIPVLFLAVAIFL
ncbi:4-hydroxybenzoate polyprenyltransferase [Rhodobacter sp. 24-YEA-8]|nr:4-hydroxybenzoate octaprenyltransferase [Rhodobacter sp. 24-YEA-8]SEC37418.1 4-hydroxybenzoate polyprenyltransferase [Rhodobacter sp. 24-YEA-8]